ncbi:hypothetical protein [Quadrisphaera sp. DSM 44207]|uniref:hypothetical protein n=1 Tax=Quadrisphaera sp. DSM 44207 TaxID=1881057 RepID=UPI00088A1862|nr:hypothetical protein [Quadrisphaera sp. DSM 44207]SDQ37847.1 hypothetical protein SAMN05428996_1468 [Quadrisphaera sp. DSM 44207]
MSTPERPATAGAIPADRAQKRLRGATIPLRTKADVQRLAALRRRLQADLAKRKGRSD